MRILFMSAVILAILTANDVAGLPLDSDMPSHSQGAGQADGAFRATDSQERGEQLLSRLDQWDRKLQGLESQKENLLDRLKEAEVELDHIRSALTQAEADCQMLEGKAKARLVALYKFKQMGYAIPLLSMKEGHGALETLYIMTRLYANDEKVFQDLHGAPPQIRDLEAKLFEKGDEAGGLKSQIGTLDAEILSAQKEKIGILTLIQQNEDLYARYNAKLQEGQNALEKRAFSRKPIFDQPVRTFSNRRGNLPLPTPGKVMAPVNSKTRSYSHTALYHRGIIIRAPKGQPVQTIHEGFVVFADWFKEYGKMMIIDHGDHYYSLIAHADRFLRTVGDNVKEGETIATVGDSGSLDGAKLYFELRHYGKPVDPLEWLAVINFSKE